MNYYNENDPQAAAWLRELIKQRFLPQGCVDERSITEVRPQDLKGFVQRHFFAGIGGWPLALRLGRWPGKMPVWTGSCPCQPFSQAGKGLAEQDERHLWPAFYQLIDACRPPVVFGEQVGGPLGNQWLAGVYADLEASGYRVPKDENGDWEAYDLPAAGVGSPQIRQRLFWVADGSIDRFKKRRSKNQEYDGDEFAAGGGANRLAWAKGNRRKRNNSQTASQKGSCEESGEPGQLSVRLERHRDAVRLGKSQYDRCQRRTQEEWRSVTSANTTLPSNPWSDWQIVVCKEPDGTFKFRRTQRGIFPLADGIPGRVGLLRGYGNAIVPQLAAEFIQAYLESRLDQ